VQSVYGVDVNWNDKHSVKKLDAWRQQLFRRNFPTRARSLHPWLQSEMETVLGHIREQMDTRKNFAWASLTNSYNRTIAGTTQKAGEKIVNAGNRKAHVLKKDRKAPWRTASSIMRSASKWQEYCDLMESYLPFVTEDENGDGKEGAVDLSDDEEEIPEPGSDPRA
jgi:hypothetical protein